MSYHYHLYWHNLHKQDIIIKFGEGKRNTMFMKLKYDQQVYLIRSDRVNSCEQLFDIIEVNFTKLPNCYVFTYIDNEEDNIVIDNEESLKSYQLNMTQLDQILINQCQNNQGNARIIQQVRKKIEKQGLRKKQSEQRKKIKVESQDSLQANKQANKIKYSQISSQRQSKNQYKHSFSKSSRKQKDIELQMPKKPQNVMQKSQKSDDFIIHTNISCNSCYQTDIIGVRHKCIECKNYNLCQNCIGRQSHAKVHKFQPISQPQLEQQQSLVDLLNLVLANRNQIKQEQALIQKNSQQMQVNATSLQSILSVSFEQAISICKKYPNRSLEQIINIQMQRRS